MQIFRNPNPILLIIGFLVKNIIVQNLFIATPYSRLFSLQNIPFTAAHTHTAHIHKHLSLISIVPTQVNSRFQNIFF